MKGFIVLKIVLFFLFCLFSFQDLFATDPLISTDVRSFSLGNIRALSDELLNPATVSFSEKKQLGISVFNRFEMSELNTASLYLKYPHKLLDMGIKLATFGYEDYRLTQLQGSFSKKIVEDLAIGIQLTYLNESSRWEEASRSHFSSGLGIYYLLNEQVDLALLGENLLHTSENASPNGYAGMKYKASGNMAFLLEAGGGKEIPFRFSAGLEYTVFERFTIRSGYDSGSQTPSFGAAYRWNRWTMDVGFSLHSVLGISSMIGVNYEL
ncbi:hypothetical protein FACS189421_09150 [Bacteroidia bacterium]|nr:hypothetical protein FACS189421_09150 [Bacteroidia bacterium]GHT04855.1 hypothetical protein FACS189423_08180 [Bacteroidia bacterium]GHT50526.1 hypothetical protein FACS189440_18090 [Bacteroidia bacterium]